MLLKDIDEALEIILNAVQNRKKITIYGDYDADGLTATALLSIFFSSLGADTSYYIPNRLEEGYGLNRDAVEKIAANGTDLIITVDCGVSDTLEVSLAKSLDMQIVITDHHQTPSDFKADCPVINPHQHDCSFPFKDLAGVGLAFFLAVAVRAALRKISWFKNEDEPDLKEYLDLVALGTVADRVPLLDQNRILVRSGMGIMAKSGWEGIRAMKEAAGVRGQDIITSDDLAFRLAPRLNAPGRMGDSGIGMQILTTEDPLLGKNLALRLNAANNLRRDVEQDILMQITRIIRSNGGIADSRILFFGSENWHKGVLGIVAARLVDQYHRPAFIFDIRDGMAVGSGRSIYGFDLYSALSRLSSLFEKFGGHAYAAGFAFKTCNIGTLKRELENIAMEALGEEDLSPVIDVDAEIPLQLITPEMIHEITALSPFGEKNPAPVFLARSLSVVGSRVVGKQHLKLTVKQGKTALDAIGFGFGGRHPLKDRAIEMIFSPELNKWQGRERIQLRIIDLKTR